MKVYSFGDVSAVVAHPSFGQYEAQGEGLGSIKVTMTTDRTVHDTAADGRVMVSKVSGRAGTIAFEIQQTSGFNKWLNNLYNYVETADSSEWAETGIILRSPNMGDLTVATGVSFKIQPERPYEAEGQKITWELMAADIQQNML